MFSLVWANRAASFFAFAMRALLPRMSLKVTSAFSPALLFVAPSVVRFAYLRVTM